MKIKAVNLWLLISILLPMVAQADNLLESKRRIENKVYFVDYRSLDYKKIYFGQREDVKLSYKASRLKFGSSKYAAFKLPHSNNPYTLELRSYVVSNRMDYDYFYPLIDVLDHDYELLYTVTAKPRVKATESIDKKYTLHEVHVNKNVAYIVVYTSPKLVGEYLNFKEFRTSTMPVQVGKYTVFQPVNTSVTQEKAYFSEIGEIEYIVPHEGYSNAFITPHGWLMEVGFAEGGDTLATSVSEGGKMQTGGGVYFSLGYAFRLPFHPHLTLRTYIGNRWLDYETNYGQSELEVYTLDFKGVYSTERINYAFGFSYHTNARFVSDQKSMRFEDTYGPSVSVEFRTFKSFYMGIGYVLMDYVDGETKETFDANQWLVYLGFTYN